MRTLQFISALAGISLAVGVACTVGVSCQKPKIVPAPSSVTVVHAMANGNPIVPKFGSDTVSRYYSSPSYGNVMLSVNYQSSRLYTCVAGATPVLVVPTTDTLFKIYSGSFDLVSNRIYSFFLSGDTAHADTTLTVDNIPYYTDSSAGARFINLSVGGKSLAVNLASDMSHTPFTTLGYKQISGFGKYNAAAAAGGSYDFEIRDQATGDLLTTFTWPYIVFRNNTIVISGSTDPASPTPLTVFSVPNY